MLAYGLWGVVPLYFKAVSSVPAIEILMHRMVWCAGLLAVVVTLAGRWCDVIRCFASPRLIGPLILSALLIAANWFLYIRSVEIGQIVQASLGYFITPLLSVLLGLLVLGEHMRPMQWVALTFSACGCVILIVVRGEIPWLGLALAGTFSLYSLARKQVPVDGLLGLTVETLLLTPVAVFFLASWYDAGTLSFGTQGTRMDVLVAASGIVTALPLLCFGQAARRLPLSSLGFLQYLSPSVQFMIAIFVFDEEFDRYRAVSFAIIWIGVILFLIDSYRAHRRDPVAS